MNQPRLRRAQRRCGCGKAADLEASGAGAACFTDLKPVSGCGGQYYVVAILGIQGVEDVPVVVEYAAGVPFERGERADQTTWFGVVVGVGVGVDVGDDVIGNDLHHRVISGVYGLYEQLNSVDLVSGGVVASSKLLCPTVLTHCAVHSGTGWGYGKVVGQPAHVGYVGELHVVLAVVIGRPVSVVHLVIVDFDVILIFWAGQEVEDGNTVVPVVVP